MRWGGDNHDIWIDPTNADRFVITDDGGMNITTVHGRGFHRVQLPIGQMYHVAVDNQVPYYVYSNMQDDGTMRGPSIPPPGAATAYPEYGWEPRHGRLRVRLHGSRSRPIPNIVWATCYGNEVTRWDARIPSWRARSAPGCTRSIRRPTTPSIAAIGPRRWPSIPSITTPSITAAR